MKKNKKYIQLYDGDGFKIKPGSILMFGCCDCGLVHKMAFEIEDNGYIGLTLEVDEKETQKYRKSVKAEGGKNN